MPPPTTPPTTAQPVNTGVKEGDIAQSTTEGVAPEMVFKTNTVPAVPDPVIASFQDGERFNSECIYDH